MNADGMAYERKIVKVRTGTQQPGTGKQLAQVVSLANFPTFGLLTPDGRHYDWAVHLCDEADDDETIQYWRERALAAEKLVEGETNEQTKASGQSGS